MLTQNQAPVAVQVVEPASSRMAETPAITSVSPVATCKETMALPPEDSARSAA